MTHRVLKLTWVCAARTSLITSFRDMAALYEGDSYFMFPLVRCIKKCIPTKEMREENFAKKMIEKALYKKPPNIFELLFLCSNKLNWACGGNCLHSRGVFGLRQVISDICFWAQHKRGAIVSWVSWNSRTSMSWFIRLKKSRIMRQKMTQNRSEQAEKCQ